MGLLLSILSLLFILLLGIIINNQRKEIESLQYHVKLLKGKNQIDHNSINKRFKEYQDKNTDRFNKLDENTNNLFTTLHAKINNNKNEIEDNTKSYLNGWKNSTEFKTMLDLIKTAEKSSTSKNTY